MPTASYLIGQVDRDRHRHRRPDWTDKIKDAGVPMDAYRDAVRADLVRDELTKKVVADATEQPSLQRQVSEIFVSTADYQGPGDEVKVRHILYTPGRQGAGCAEPGRLGRSGLGDGQGQGAGDVRQAQGAAGKPDELDTAVRGDRQDRQPRHGLGAPTAGSSSGSPGARSTPASATRSSRTGSRRATSSGRSRASTAGTSSCSRARRGPPESRIAGLQVQANAPGADFAALAKANSDSAEAANGGDLGWVARYQLDPEREEAIFAAPIGKVSEPLKTDSGYYLFLVRDEQTRTARRRPARDAQGQRVPELVCGRRRRRRTITPDLSAGSS